METLAVAIAELAGQLWYVFYTIVLPVLLLAAVGWVIQRKVGLDMTTLKRLNFHLVIPVMIYYSLVTSTLNWRTAGTVIFFTVAMVVAQSTLAYLVGWLKRMPRDLRGVLVMTTMSYNSGNFGIPLQEMAFSRAGLSEPAMLYQAIVMITQNLSNFTWGIFVLAGTGKGRTVKDNLVHIATFPPIWAMAAGLATIQIRNWMGPDASGLLADRLAPIWQVLLYIKNAFIAVALCTLGAQLATVTRGGKKYPVSVSVILRLLVGPAIGLAMIYAFGLTGFLAQVMLISTASPTAVNCMLLSMEFENNPDYAARAVFYSTLLSPVTVTLVIYLAQGGLLPGF